MNRKVHLLPSPCGMRRPGFRACLGLVVALLLSPCLRAGETSPAELGVAALHDGTITDTNTGWSMTNEQRERAYPLRLEMRVNFCDPAWHNLWYDLAGEGRYIQLAANAPLLRNGQRVRIEGTFVPKQGIVADRVRVTVLDEFVGVTPVPTNGCIGEVPLFDRKIVVTEGYVDEQQLIDSQHLRLTMLIDDRRVICWVPPDPNNALPNWQGCRLRVIAVYSGRIDPTGTEATVELWTARQSDISVIGNIATDPRFAIPLTQTGRLNEVRVGSVVRLRGKIRQREIGSNFILRDRTGEVWVDSLQRERLQPETEVEVVGRMAIVGSRWVLQTALFRRAISNDPREPESTGGAIDLIDRIRQLSPADAAAGQPVDIRGVVTWSIADADFFFIQDLSGGVRVRLPQGMPPPPLQRYARVVGKTYQGPFGPAVELQQLHDITAMAHPFPKRITYSQAITGSEDGQWVEMRGFIRRTASEGDWRWIYVTTPEGEFTGHLWSQVNFVATPGSLLRVHGVCEVTTDAKNRISGVRLRVPYLHDIVIEADAPDDVYDLPLRKVGDLRRLFAMEGLVRARVAAQVVHHVSGQSIIVQDGDDALTIFSREPGQLVPGDMIEAVGIVGRDGARMVLREAVSRRTRVGLPPAPVELGDATAQDFRNDLRLVSVEATLIDFSRHTNLLRLTLQSGNAIFDALLEHPADGGPQVDLAAGMMLRLTGVYRIVFDDSYRPRGFQMQLRSGADLVVVKPARFWTVPRALLALVALAGCMLAGFVWVAALRHRVRAQTEQIREQLEKQSNLENELERAQRFRSLGLLAGGLAHDFNNLLTGILGNVTLAMLEERVMALVGDSLRDIEASAKRARDLTQQLVTFAKGGAPVRDNVPLPELLQSAAGFALSGAKARAEYRIAPEIWPVHADRNQLGRALQNLIVHARASMPEGGIIAFHAENEVCDSATAALPAGRYVRVTIADHGPGLSPERLPGFFDPYSATKFGDDRFAMAIAYSIVKRHGGHIEVESSLGLGTVFQLWIPAAAERPQPAATEAEAEALALPMGIAGTRVLLMDDEETIRRLGERLLAKLQCEYRTVPDGATCLAVYREALAAGRRYQIVILDLTVPGGMGGAECMAELRRIDPDVRAIVSSGYSNDPVMANYRQHGFRLVVTKPYTAGVLAEAIRRVLGAPV
jgi:signal transduction histidine kinase/uncharacterized protein YdeI (BOF family)